MSETINLSNLKNSLAGKLLVATPSLEDSCFTRSVIYLCAHSEDGAMGLIVNYEVENVHLKEILTQLEIGSPPHARQLPVHFGGPVESNRGFVVHSADYASSESLIEQDGIAVTASINVLKELAEGGGPAKGMLVLGYAGWSPGQLESEIEQGSWIVVPASSNLIFSSDNDAKWSQAVSALGIDIGHFSSAVGHA